MILDETVVGKKRKDYLCWDEFFMGIAELAAKRSKDPSTQVGCCIVDKENRILSIGYNGTPNGFPDDEFPWSREGKSINETKGLEEQIETMLKDEFKYDSFVKISKDQINIVISSSEHNKDIANNIIKKVQSMYNTKKYITIKFQ